MKEWLRENAAEWYNPDAEYASLIEQCYPLPSNRRAFFETEVSEKLPSIGYAYLVRMAEAGLIRTIFTTNFDDLLNEAFYQFSPERAIVCAHDSSVDSVSITSRRTKIMKLHGDYLLGPLKSTAAETQHLEENMRNKLTEFLKEYGLIITGYSGSDKSITRILQDLLDNRPYLQNGLYWCLRENDSVPQDVESLLVHPKAFYVLTPGFDELMADLYTILPTNSTPFSSNLASDRASKIIDSYLQNSQLKESSSATIRKHLEDLEVDRKASHLLDVMKELNSEQFTSAGLTDQHLLEYLEIETALKGRDPDSALAKLAAALSRTTDRRFKEMLLQQRYLCASRLNMFREAAEATKELLRLEPNNFYISLNECALLEDPETRLNHLRHLMDSHPYSTAVLNEYAEELGTLTARGFKLIPEHRKESPIKLLQRSLVINPSIGNSAWSMLFSEYAREGESAATKDNLASIVDKHLEQDAYDPKTTNILFRYCQKYRTDRYKGKQIFDYLQEAYRKDFPRNDTAHLRVFVNACTEFDGHRYLRPLIEFLLEDGYVREEPQFAQILIDIHHDIFRDLLGAITYGESFLKSRKDTKVEITSLRKCLLNRAIGKARDYHRKLRGAVDTTSFMLLESDILEAEGRYQDAIDLIESVPDRRDHRERHTVTLSFLELKLGAYAKAKKRCRDLLEERHFSLSCEGELINFEVAKKLDGGDVNKERIAKLLEVTDSQMVKGVCHCLLGSTDRAVEIFREEAEKRFSKIDECLRWPALTAVIPDLQRIREELSKRKRSLTDLPRADDFVLKAEVYNTVQEHGVRCVSVTPTASGG